MLLIAPFLLAFVLASGGSGPEHQLLADSFA